jgi:hypothetical protein
MNKWVRQTHRWVSIAFTITVIANFIALAQGGGMPPAWVTYSPLLPLACSCSPVCTCSCCRMPPSGGVGGSRSERPSPSKERHAERDQSDAE